MSDTAQSHPPAPITIRHDAIWNLYANVTDEQLPKIARYFLATDEELYLNEKTAARLHAPGLNFIVFPERHRAALLKEFAARHCPLTAAREIVETPPPYHPPILQFLSLPEPKHHLHDAPPDYYQTTLGLTPADIPELIRLFQDPEIALAECIEDSPVRWTRIHAQRALVELRAPAAARLMLGEIRAAGEEAGTLIITTDAEQLLPQLGSDAYTTTLAFLDENRDNTTLHWNLLPLLAEIAKETAPEHRDHCIATITRRLEDHPVNDRFHNALLAAALCDLKAVEATPLIEQAYAADRIDVSYYGDWEEAQIGLGLKTERDTPEQVLRNAIRRERNLPPLPLFDDDDADTNNTPIRHATPKPGRNDPCPCGSGKKYKKCCMDKPA